MSKTTIDPTLTPNVLPLVGGTMSGVITMGSNKITSLANGTATTDAAAFGQVTPLFTYRRPNLVFGSTTVVSVETGLDGISGDVVILFSDGNVRTETSSTRYQATTTQNAVFTNATLGNNQGGIRSGSVTTNTWYAAYAVKVTTFASNWVMVLDTVLPLQPNYSTLNTNFGTNSWVYLGMVRYGDNSGSTNAILSFKQYGHSTSFLNTSVGQAFNQHGIRLASSLSATSITYSATAGTGTTDIPTNCTMGEFGGGVNGGAGATTMALTEQNTTTNIFARMAVGGATTINGIFHSGLTYLGNGAIVTVNVSGSLDIFLLSFVDGVLGVGSNPLL